ncbi:hypothetical protein IMCC21224_11136 [Puniceibacterium sp. IMCC21224]|nr:hypothetical protein IMCC21224_11136 [Puniceibacterium sp. IMCC21224]
MTGGHRTAWSNFSYAAWLNHRFAPSLRYLVNLLAERGVTVADDTSGGDACASDRKSQPGSDVTVMHPPQIT